MLAIFSNWMRNTSKLIDLIYLNSGYMYLIKTTILQIGLCLTDFNAFFDLFNPVSPRLRMPFTYVVHVCSDIALSKSHIGSGDWSI